MKLKVLRMIPGATHYEVGQVYEFGDNVAWHLQGGYCEPVKESPEKASLKPGQTPEK